MYKLKACPFCGGEPWLRFHEMRGIYIGEALCTWCHASLVDDEEWHEEKKSAAFSVVTKWNRRVNNEPTN